MAQSQYLNNIRKEECKKFKRTKFTKDDLKWYIIHQHPISYVANKSNKLAGTIHYSNKFGFYWMPINSMNSYKINPDGSLGANITYEKK